MKFYPSGVLKFMPQNSLSEIDENGLIKTKYVKIRSDKSKVSRPHTETVTYLNTSPDTKIAIDKIRECVDYATQYDIFKTAGSWVTILDAEGNEVIKLQGNARVANEMKRNVDLYTSVKMRVYSIGLPNEMFATKFEEIKLMLETENKLMKENKVRQLTIRNRTDMITENDKKEFKFDEKQDVKYYIGEENYNATIYNLKNDEAKEKHAKELKKTMEKIELYEKKEEEDSGDIITVINN